MEWGDSSLNRRRLRLASYLQDGQERDFFATMASYGGPQEQQQVSSAMRMLVSHCCHSRLDGTVLG